MFSPFVVQNWGTLVPDSYMCYFMNECKSTPLYIVQFKLKMSRPIARLLYRNTLLTVLSLLSVKEEEGSLVKNVWSRSKQRNDFAIIVQQFIILSVILDLNYVI